MGRTHTPECRVGPLRSPAQPSARGAPAPASTGGHARPTALRFSPFYPPHPPLGREPGLRGSTRDQPMAGAAVLAAPGGSWTCSRACSHAGSLTDFGAFGPSLDGCDCAHLRPRAVWVRACLPLEHARTCHWSLLPNAQADGCGLNQA